MSDQTERRIEMARELATLTAKVETISGTLKDLLEFQKSITALENRLKGAQQVVWIMCSAIVGFAGFCIWAYQQLKALLT